MKRFTHEPMHYIIAALKQELQHCNTHEHIRFEVINPDISPTSYAGEIIIIEKTSFIHRGYKDWTDLAQLLFCRMLTPVKSSGHTVMLTFQKLDEAASFHSSAVPNKTEKYGVDSAFFAINKAEESSFVYYYLQALKAVKILEKRALLNLGINGGDEFQIIKEMLSDKEYSKLHLMGIDHCASAIRYAKERFNTSNVTLIEHDINHLKSLKLDRFDLILSIGTLQSPGVDFKPLFMSLVQDYLTPEGAIILGFPNSRWIDAEMIYGAMAPNYSYSELSLVIKDIYFCKKYLQQHRFRVSLSGKDYIFLTATRIGGAL
jgi:hypothetical protein